MTLLFLVSLTALLGLQTQDNVFLPWAHLYANFRNTSNCCVCGAMPLSVIDGPPWWVSPLRRGDFSPLCSFFETTTGNISLVTHH